MNDETFNIYICKLWKMLWFLTLFTLLFLFSSAIVSFYTRCFLVYHFKLIFYYYVYLSYYLSDSPTLQLTVSNNLVQITTNLILTVYRNLFQYTLLLFSLLTPLCCNNTDLFLAYVYVCYMHICVHVYKCMSILVYRSIHSHMCV